MQFIVRESEAPSRILSMLQISLGSKGTINRWAVDRAHSQASPQMGVRRTLFFIFIFIFYLVTKDDGIPPSREIKYISEGFQPRRDCGVLEEEEARHRVYGHHSRPRGSPDGP